MAVVDDVFRELLDDWVACSVIRGPKTAKVWVMATNAVFNIALTESASATENEGACDEFLDTERTGGIAVVVEPALYDILVDLANMSHSNRFAVTKVQGGLRVYD
jgi:hypothetical protein